MNPRRWSASVAQSSLTLCRASRPALRPRSLAMLVTPTSMANKTSRPHVFALDALRMDDQVWLHEGVDAKVDRRVDPAPKLIEQCASDTEIESRLNPFTGLGPRLHRRDLAFD